METSWHLLLNLLNQQRRLMIPAVLLALLAGAAELAPIIVLYQLFADWLTAPDQTMMRIDQYAAALALFLVAKSILYTASYYLSHQASFMLLVDTRYQLVNKIASASLSWLHQYSAGKVKCNLMQDVENIENFFAHHTVEVTVALAVPLYLLAALLWLDWRLALAALAVVPLALAVTLIINSGLSEQYQSFNKSAEALDSVSVELLRNITVMKLFRQDAERSKTIQASLDQYYDLVRGLTKRTVPSWSLFTTLIGANVMVLLPTGLYLIEQGQISQLQLLCALLLASGMLKPLLKISRFSMEMQQVLASAQHLLPIVSIEPKNPKPEVLLQSPIKLEIKSIHCAQGGRWVLNGLNLTLAANSLNVLVGGSGSGKTTLANVLAGLISPEHGQVLLNGICASTLSEKQRSQLIAVAGQEAFLFKGSLRENLLLAAPSASDKELLAVLDVAQARVIIENLPYGLDTEVEELGATLSGGERQRLALARALLSDAPVMILDEVSASLDNVTQQALFRSIGKAYSNKTILVITHRCCGLESADQINVLQSGHIVAAGKHSDLLQKNVFYQQLWLHQNANEDWRLGGQPSDTQLNSASRTL